VTLWRILDRLARDGEAGLGPDDPQRGDLPAGEFSPEGLAGKLLAAAGGSVTAVDIEELGPNVLAGRIGVTGPAGSQQVTASAGGALALAAALEVPVRVPHALMDRLAIPVTGGDLLTPFVSRTPARPSGPRSGPRNLAFADGLDGWVIGGSASGDIFIAPAGGGYSAGPEIVTTAGKVLWFHRHRRDRPQSACSRGCFRDRRDGDLGGAWHHRPPYPRVPGLPLSGESIPIRSRRGRASRRG
jgi:hypothetical protein